MSKAKGFFAEFKTFIARGNVMDLAVGVIIGGAFKSIVDSLVNDIIMPLIGFVTGGIDFSNFFFALSKDKFSTIAEAQKAGVATLNYGKFISSIITFLIMAFVIFMLIKGLNKLADLGKKNKDAPASPTTKVCPYCKSEIAIDATKCSSCTSELNQ